MHTRPRLFTCPEAFSGFAFTRFDGGPDAGLTLTGEVTPRVDTAWTHPSETDDLAGLVDARKARGYKHVSLLRV